MHWPSGSPTAFSSQENRLGSERDAEFLVDGGANCSHRSQHVGTRGAPVIDQDQRLLFKHADRPKALALPACLLYTSDAADE